MASSTDVLLSGAETGPNARASALIMCACWFFRRYGDRVIEPEIELVFA